MSLRALIAAQDTCEHCGAPIRNGRHAGGHHLSQLARERAHAIDLLAYRLAQLGSVTPAEIALRNVATVPDAQKWPFYVTVTFLERSWAGGGETPAEARDALAVVLSIAAEDHGRDQFAREAERSA